MTMFAYRGTESKADLMARLEEHQQLDQVVQRVYWADGKGCAVGCATHDPTGGHDKYPALWGIPEQLAYLEDQIFESLDVETSKSWPLRFMGAIPEGADLSRIWDQWCVWMLRRLIAKSPVALPEVEVMASLFERACSGDEPSDTEWSGAAEAARAVGAVGAVGAAWAAWAAEAAEAVGAARAAARHEWAVAAADELVRLVQLAPIPAAA